MSGLQQLRVGEFYEVFNRQDIFDLNFGFNKEKDF